MMEQASPPPPADAVAETSQPAPPRVCAVKFRNAGRTFEYDPNGASLKRGDLVLVEFAEAEVVATVARAGALREQQNAQPAAGLPKIIRVLGDADKPALETLRQKENDAFKFALTKLRARGLPAKMVAAEMSFRQDRITFYVASEDRLDLRAWIRDLSTEFRARIDIRQIGARDAAKFIGGIGSCGRELCCSSWLVEFRPVSIKMAKDQNLALNPEKVSGQCGRLLCCLTYEQDTYRDMRKGLPKVGKRVYTPLGDGRVKDVNVLRRKVRVQLAEGYEELDADQVSPMFGQKGELLQPNFGAPAAFEDEDGDETEGVEAKEGAAPAAPAPQAERPQQQNRGPRQDRPRDDRGPRRDDRGPRQDRPRDDRPRDDRPRNDRPRDERGPRPDRGPRPGGDRPRDDRGPRQDRPRNDQGPRPERQAPPQPVIPAAQQKAPPEQARPDDAELDDETDDGADDDQSPEQQATGQQTPGQPGPDGQRRRRRRRRRGRGGRGGGGGGNPGGGQGGGTPGGGGQP